MGGVDALNELLKTRLNLLTCNLSGSGSELEFILRNLAQYYQNHRFMKCRWIVACLCRAIALARPDDIDYCS
jgi:hypothetical protein